MQSRKDILHQENVESKGGWAGGEKGSSSYNHMWGGASGSVSSLDCFNGNKSRLLLAFARMVEIWPPIRDVKPANLTARVEIALPKNTRH